MTHLRTTSSLRLSRLWRRLNGKLDAKSASLSAVLLGLLGGALLIGSSGASTPVASPAAGTEQAERTTTALANALVAAVASISDATPPGATLTEIEANSEAVSILLPECQNTYKLIDASGSPLDPDNVPKSNFEASALMELIGGAPLVQETIGGHLRTLVPLTSDMHPNCMTCHTNYGAFAPGTVVGAAVFKVKL